MLCTSSLASAPQATDRQSLLRTQVQVFRARLESEQLSMYVTRWPQPRTPRVRASISVIRSCCAGQSRSKDARERSWLTLAPHPRSAKSDATRNGPRTVLICNSESQVIARVKLDCGHCPSLQQWLDGSGGFELISRIPSRRSWRCRSTGLHASLVPSARAARPREHRRTFQGPASRPEHQGSSASPMRIPQESRAPLHVWRSSGHLAQFDRLNLSSPKKLLNRRRGRPAQEQEVL